VQKSSLKTSKVGTGGETQETKRQHQEVRENQRDRFRGHLWNSEQEGLKKGGREKRDSPWPMIGIEEDCAAAIEKELSNTWGESKSYSQRKRSVEEVLKEKILRWDTAREHVAGMKGKLMRKRGGPGLGQTHVQVA